MNVLISGATGFIGKHLVQTLLKNDYNVFPLVRAGGNRGVEFDKLKVFEYNNDMNEMIQFFRNHSIEGVIHLASLFKSQHVSDEIDRMIESNIAIGTHLLEASVNTNTKWFINTGTFWQHLNDSDFNPVNLYAATKQAFEDIAKFYIETSSLSFITLKINDTYGPDDNRKKIVNTWLEISKTGDLLKMSPGEQLIDILYIDDIINAYMIAIEMLQTKQNKLYESFVVSSQNHLTLKDFALKFEEISKKKLNIEWGALTYRPREVMKPYKGGIMLPGWSPHISIEEGLKRIIQPELENK